MTSGHGHAAGRSRGLRARLRRSAAVTLAVAVTAGSVVVGGAPVANAAAATNGGVHIAWPDLTWSPGVCTDVPVAWQSVSSVYTARLSTRDIDGRPVDLSGGTAASTASVALGTSLGAGRSGRVTMRICGPATRVEARGLRLVLLVEGWGDLEVEEQVATPLFASIPLVGAPLPPGPVRDLEADTGNGRITFSWSGPADPGDAPVSGYEYRIEGAGWIPTADRRLTLTDLPNWESVRLQVRARNAHGTGPEETVYGTPTQVTRGPADESLPRCGARVERDSLPEPVYGKRCVEKVRFDVWMSRGQSPVTLSRYDVSKRYWNFRVEAPSKDWRVRGATYRRTSSGGLAVVNRWSHGSDGYRLFHSYVYPARLGPGSYLIRNVVALTEPTEYCWVRDEAASGHYEVCNRTRFRETVTVSFRIA